MDIESGLTYAQFRKAYQARTKKATLDDIVEAWNEYVDQEENESSADEEDLPEHMSGHIWVYPKHLRKEYPQIDEETSARIERCYISVIQGKQKGPSCPHTSVNFITMERTLPDGEKLEIRRIRNPAFK